MLKQKYYYSQKEYYIYYTSTDGNPVTPNFQIDGNELVDASINKYRIILHNLPTLTSTDLTPTIPEEAFRNCTNLASVEIPSDFVIIGVDAFSYCTNLVSISIPNSITHIYGYAFRHDPSL